MSKSNVPSWEELRGLIERADEVCRESEFLRHRAERQMRQPGVWPDRHEPGSFSATHPPPPSRHHASTSEEDETL